MITFPGWRKFFQSIIGFRWLVIHWTDGTSSNVTPWLLLLILWWWYA